MEHTHSQPSLTELEKFIVEFTRSKEWIECYRMEHIIYKKGLYSTEQLRNRSVELGVDYVELVGFGSYEARLDRDSTYSIYEVGSQEDAMILAMTEGMSYVRNEDQC